MKTKLMLTPGRKGMVDGVKGVSTSMRLELPFWPKNVDCQREWGKLLADTLRKSHGKTLAHFLPQGPLSLKVKKDFQRIYEFQAEPERQTKPSIYICEQVRAKNSEILSSQTSLPRQEMEILKFKKHNLRCSQRFGGRRENGWCLRSTKKKKQSRAKTVK